MLSDGFSPAALISLYCQDCALQHFILFSTEPDPSLRATGRPNISSDTCSYWWDLGVDSFWEGRRDDAVGLPGKSLEGSFPHRSPFLLYFSQTKSVKH